MKKYEHAVEKKGSKENKEKHQEKEKALKKHTRNKSVHLEHRVDLGSRKGFCTVVWRLGVRWVMIRLKTQLLNFLFLTGYLHG